MKTLRSTPNIWWRLTAQPMKWNIFPWNVSSRLPFYRNESKKSWFFWSKLFIFFALDGLSAIFQLQKRHKTIYKSWYILPSKKRNKKLTQNFTTLTDSCDFPRFTNSLQYHSSDKTRRKKSNSTFQPRFTCSQRFKLATNKKWTYTNCDFNPLWNFSAFYIS